MPTKRLQPAHEIVGELSDGYELALKVADTKPDVVIMHFHMPM